MRLINLRTNQKDVPVLETKRLVLRRPQLADFEEWAELRFQSADFLQPLEPRWTNDELSKTAFSARLKRQASDINTGRGLSWFLFSKESEKLIGGLSISNIRRGVAQAGTVGYWTGQPFAGQGYMGEALQAVCTACFELYSLHRLEAGTVMHNERSQRLLRSCGFREEGIARAYLKIADQWEDHILFARLSSDSSPTPNKN